MKTCRRPIRLQAARQVFTGNTNRRPSSRVRRGPESGDSKQWRRSRKETALCLRWLGMTCTKRHAPGRCQCRRGRIPTDAMVTIDDAGRSSGDATPERADAPELLDVEVYQFAWMVALIAPDRSAARGPRAVEAEPRQNAADVTGDTPTLQRSAGRVASLPHASTAAHAAGGSGLAMKEVWTAVL